LPVRSFERSPVPNRNQKGQWRDRFFQLRGTNALFMFSSAKDSMPLKLYNLCGCKLALAQGEDVEGAKVNPLDSPLLRHWPTSARPHRLHDRRPAITVSG
jgi:hypothetical protein